MFSNRSDKHLLNKIDAMWREYEGTGNPHILSDIWVVEYELQNNRRRRAEEIAKTRQTKRLRNGANGKED